MTTVAAAERKPGWRFWRDVAMATVMNFLDPDTSPRCAGAAFFGFLSLFPAIATVALIVGLVLDPAMLRGTLSVLQYVLPQGALRLLEEQLLRLTVQPEAALGLGLLISVPLALWSGSRGVDALLFALSQVRGQKERRGFLTQVVVAIGTTMIGGVFVAIALLTVAGLPALIPFPTGEDVLLLVLRWPILLALTIVIFALLYRFGPDRHPHRFRFIWPGAVLASTLWILAGAVFSIYVENWGNFELTFGSVSAAVVLLLWMYNSTQILVLGAAFNAEIQRALTGNPRREVESRDA
jgi:membrane protein